MQKLCLTQKNFKPKSGRWSEAFSRLSRGPVQYFLDLLPSTASLEVWISQYYFQIESKVGRFESVWKEVISSLSKGPRTGPKYMCIENIFEGVWKELPQKVPCGLKFFLDANNN